MNCPVKEILTAIASHSIEGLLVSNDKLLDEPLAKDQLLVELAESELIQDRGLSIYFAQAN
jgi:hypothetical protein